MEPRDLKKWSTGTHINGAKAGGLEPNHPIMEPEAEQNTWNLGGNTLQRFEKRGNSTK